MIQERVQVVRVRVRLGRRVGPSKTANVETDHPVMSGKLVELRVPHAAIQLPTMKQNDRFAGAFGLKVNALELSGLCPNTISEHQNDGHKERERGPADCSHIIFG